MESSEDFPTVDNLKLPKIDLQHLMVSDFQLVKSGYMNNIIILIQKVRVKQI